MNELRNSDCNLNLYSSRLITEADYKRSDSKESHDNFNIIKTIRTNVHIPKMSLNSNVHNEKKKSPLKREFTKENNNDILNLINAYDYIGSVHINFINILNENEDQIVRRSSKFFQNMNNQRRNSSKKIDLNKNNNNNNNNYFNPDQITYNLIFFENIIQKYTNDIYYKGNLIGKITLSISVKHIPLLRQIMFGVMTETGFEVNSIFLHDNLNNNNLPEEILDLIKMKKDLENSLTQIDNVYFLVKLKKIKEILAKSIEESVLYYGYSKNIDLFQGQGIILEMGNNILEVIEKLNMEQRKESFEILKLINRRYEFDLNSLTKWFKKREKGDEFRDDFLIENKIVENFIKFNNLALNFSFDSISKGKNIDNDNKMFSYNFLSSAYFKIPFYREQFLMSISNENMKIESKNEIINEKNPLNNLILWENLFYKKLYKSIELYNEKYPNNSDINDLNENLLDMKEIISYSNEYNKKNNWKSRLKKREFVFYDLIYYLVIFIKDKLENNNLNYYSYIPGFEIIMNVIENEIKINNIKQLNNYFLRLLPVFENVNIINHLLLKIIESCSRLNMATLIALPAFTATGLP